MSLVTQPLVLKRKMNLPTLLKFPMFDKPFEEHTKANDFAMSKLLTQDEPPLHMKARNAMVLKGDDQFMRNSYLL